MRCALRWPGCGKYHVDGVYIILSHKRADDQAPPDPAAFAWQVAELSVSGAALAGGDLRARFAASSETRKSTAREARSTKVLVLGVRSYQPRVTRMQKLSTAQEDIHKASCAWRTPPPSRGKSRMQKLSAAQKAARRVPPPIRGRPRYYPYAKVISGAKSGPPCTPPHPGQAPLLPVCKSYQQCTKRPP